MGYYLNPRELTAMFAVPASVTDKHLKLASGESLKVLLWCLKNADKQFDVTAISEALKLDEYSVRESLDFWVERSVLCTTAEVKPAAEPEKKPKAVRSATVKPGRDEIARRGLEDPEIAFILRESEQKLGHILRQSEASTLVWLHDDLGLSASLIMMIVGYAVTEGRGNIGFIERIAVEWVNDGVEDIEAAEQRLIDMGRRKSAWHVVETAMGLPKRQPTKSELETADLWVNEWNYGYDIIKTAYETCIDTISEFKMPYIKKIISEWHKAGVKTVDDISKLNAKKAQPTKKDPPSDYSDFISGLISKNEEEC